MIGGETPLEVVDDVGRVAAAELGHGHVDALVVLLQVDLHVLLQLHARAGLGGQGVLVEDAAVEEVVAGQLSEEEVSVDVDGGEHEAHKQHDHAHRQVAHAAHRAPLLVAVVGGPLLPSRRQQDLSGRGGRRGGGRGRSLVGLVALDAGHRRLEADLHHGCARPCVRPAASARAATTGAAWICM